MEMKFSPPSLCLFVSVPERQWKGKEDNIKGNIY